MSTVRVNVDALRYAVESSPFSQKQLALYVGKSVGYLSKVIKNASIDEEALEKICTLLAQDKAKFIAESPTQPTERVSGDGGTDLSALIDVLERIDAKLAMIRNDGISQTNLINAKFNKVLQELGVHENEV